MDKIKEKLDKLRIEADSNLSRAEKAEAEVKDVKAAMARHENEVLALQNKISLLQMDLDRAEKRAEDNKLKKAESDKGDSLNETLQRKIQMLEKQVDDKEALRKEAVERIRTVELESETHERKAKQLEAERSDMAIRLGDMSKKYEKVKADLDQTLKDLEGL